MSSKSKGNTAERVVLDFLRKQGFMGEIIETKMRLARIGGRVVQVADKGTKLGDIFGVWSGRAVLVEVKAHDEELLQYSVLADHQHDNLVSWYGRAGDAYVAWVRGTRLRLLPYPVGWVARTSLKWGDYA